MIVIACNRDRFVRSFDNTAPNGIAAKLCPETAMSFRTGLFDRDGRVICAARTSQDRIAWGETDLIRSYTQSRKLPVELRIRRTNNSCFSDEQEAKVSECVNIWKQICFSTESNNHQVTVEAIKAAYEIAGFAVEPELIFFDSPYAAYKPIIDEIKTEIQPDASTDEFNRKLMSGLDKHFNPQYCVRLLQQLVDTLEEQVNTQVDDKLRKDIFMALYDSLWVEQSELLMKLIESSSPIEFLFDREGELHAEEGPAIQFADGFSVYANRGNIERIVADRV